MSDERQPTTDAGKAMLQAWAQRSWSRFALRSAILDIEDEARQAPDIAVSGVSLDGAPAQDGTHEEDAPAAVSQDQSGWVSGWVHLPDVRAEVGRDANRMVPAHGYSTGVPSPRGYEPVTLPARGVDGHAHIWGRDDLIEYCRQDGCEAWRAKS